MQTVEAKIKELEKREKNVPDLKVFRMPYGWYQIEYNGLKALAHPYRTDKQEEIIIDTILSMTTPLGLLL